MQIRRALEAKGFRDIRVLPEAFVIRAQAPDGSHVVMEVTPESFQAVVLNRGNQQNNQSMRQYGMNQQPDNRGGFMGNNFGR